MELFRNTNFNFLRLKWPFVGLSLALTAAGLISLLIKGGPSYGIDFRGGTIVYVKFRETPQLDRLRQALRERRMGESTIQRYGAERENEVLISLDLRDQPSDQSLDAGRNAILEALRATFAGDQGQKMDFNNVGRDTIAARLASYGMSEPAAAQLASAIVERRTERSGLLSGVGDIRGLPGLTPQLEEALAKDSYFAPYALRNAEIVGPRVGSELRRQALYATLYALAGMLVYIAFRFEWVYGVAAVVATLHDVIVTIGFFSIFNYEISLTVVAGLLTLIGFSVNDTIVVFDRIRENLRLMRREPLGEIVNRSINQTLSRTVLTTGLTFITVVTLFLFGGEVLRGFSFALLVGILVGTYSSICVAAPIIVVWQEWYETRKSSGRVVTLERDRIREKPKVSARVKA